MDTHNRYLLHSFGSVNVNKCHQQLKDHQTCLLFAVFDILVINNVRSRRGVVMRAAGEAFARGTKPPVRILWAQTCAPTHILLIWLFV